MINFFVWSVVILGAVCGVYQFLNDQLNLEDDNLVEEAIEEIIENETGINIDLTPNSPEKHQQ